MRIDLSDLFRSGRVVDLILVLVACEALLLVAYRRATRRGVKPLDLIGQLLAGALLLLALRCALTGANYRWTALFLAASFPAHLFDVLRRARSHDQASGMPPS